MIDDGGSRYRIESQLGSGGMGEVWLARDSKLKRRVALKLLASSPGDDIEGARRLLREAKSLAALDHPFICKTYETGEIDGRPFIAMEYVEGSTLKQRLDTGPVPVREALRISLEIAEALDYAHRHGIVHRDLKPANIIVTPEHHVKLLDFGIARRLPAACSEGSDETSMTLSEGGFCGTLAYMSPEQLEGRPADAQSDIFSFGLLLYEMLTGTHPYQRSSPTAIASAILTDPAPPLSEHLSPVPGLLGHVVGRMLAKDRGTRYQSARDLVGELTALLEPPAAVPVDPVRTRRWRVALPLTVSVIGALAIVLSVVLMMDWLHVSEAALAFKERDWVLIADFENLTGDAAFDKPLQSALALGIEQSQHVNVMPQARIREALQRMQRPKEQRLDMDLASEMAVREGATGVIAGSVAQIGDKYVLTARVIDPKSRTAVLTQSTKANGKSEVLSALDELGKRIRRDLGESLAGMEKQNRPLPLATTASLEALNVFVESRHALGSDGARQVSLLQQAVQIDPDFALAHADLGLALYLRGSRIEGEKHFQRALFLLDRLTTREQLWIKALADDTRGNREQAVSHYEAYLAQYPDDTSAWFRLGWALMAGLGRYEAAADAFNHVLTIDPAESSAQVNLATCYSGLRREREAVAAYERAFKLKPNLVTGVFVNHEYGFTLVRAGEIQKAAGVFKTMTEQKEQSLQARGRRSLGLLEMYRGRYTAAAAQLREAILLDRAMHAGLSEFRDRLFLARVLEARGLSAAARQEIAGVSKMAAGMSLAPGWLYILGKALARQGAIGEADRVLALLPATAADPTAASNINRSTRGDEVSARLLRGEIALARGRAEDALVEFELAHRLRPDSDSLEARATTYLVLKRHEEAAAALSQLIERADLGRESQQDWLMAHLRLASLYETTGKRDAAAKLYEALQAIWADADADLPAARQLGERLQRLRKPAA